MKKMFVGLILALLFIYLSIRGVDWEMFINARYSKLHMGNFTEERFIDIFSSDRYSRTMSYLASPAFDAQTMMGTLPIQHYVSIALDNHLKRIKKITPANGRKPLHVNFL